MVTDGGTPNSRQPCCAPGAAAAMNWALVVTGPVVGTAEPAQVGTAAERTYACETYAPFVSRSHWFVLRTVPVTCSPATPQAMATAAPAATWPVIAADREAPARRFTLPSLLVTVPVTGAAAGALTHFGKPALRT